MIAQNFGEGKPSDKEYTMTTIARRKRLSLRSRMVPRLPSSNDIDTATVARRLSLLSALLSVLLAHVPAAPFTLTAVVKCAAGVCCPEANAICYPDSDPVVGYIYVDGSACPPTAEQQ